MKTKITKSIIAVVGIASVLLLAGCGNDKSANSAVESSNSYYVQFEGEDKTVEDIKNLINKIELDNASNAGKKDYPTIKYEGPIAEELDENFSYKVEIKELNSNGLVSCIKVTEY